MRENPNEERLVKKVEREKRIVALMIELYCRKIEGNNTLCQECLDLIEYAHNRLNRCKFADNKPACKKCIVHCYSPIKREKIRLVMRTIGPRMILYRPIEAIRHLLGG